MGVGEAKDNAKLLDSAIADLEKITGQKAVVCRARKSVANFKLREGMACLLYTSMPAGVYIDIKMKNK